MILPVPMPLWNVKRVTLNPEWHDKDSDFKIQRLTPCDPCRVYQPNDPAMKKRPATVQGAGETSLFDCQRADLNSSHLRCF